MVKDISYSEEDLNFILTSTIGNKLASKKKKKKKYPRTLVVPVMFKVKVDSQRVILTILLNTYYTEAPLCEVIHIKHFFWSPIRNILS